MHNIHDCQCYFYCAERMESAFNNIVSQKGPLPLINREILVKSTILDTLSDNIKEIQYNLTENEEDLLLNENTLALCTSIEAIFLHGLKDSFLSHTLNVLVGESTRKPSPNFWVALLLFLHRHSIEQIYALSQITTEIGYCRAWVRQSLNESVLSSHIANMRKSSKAFLPYYKSCAFVRDQEYLELAENVIGGIEACARFHLPVNSSLLNHWTDQPLQLSGIYIPPIHLSPIASGIDVANSNTLFGSIDTKVKQSQPERCPPSTSNTELIVHMADNQNDPAGRTTPIDIGVECNLNLDDDIENDVRLTALLSKIDKVNNPTEHLETSKIESLHKHLIENVDEKGLDVSSEPLTSMLEKNEDNQSSSNHVVGNLLTLNRGWSSECGTELDEAITTENPPSVSDDTSSAPLSQQNMKSELKGCLNDVPYVSNNLTEIWTQFQELLERNKAIIGSDNVEVNENLNEETSIDYLRQMVYHTYSIPHQLGLDEQNFTCASCKNPLGVGGGEQETAMLCEFDGKYYCSECMATDLYAIPSRIINNWDFRKYQVSHKAAAFLHEYKHYAFIDIKLLNPDIYTYVNDMRELRALRIQLNYIRAYLFTCSSRIVEQLKKQLWCKDYLFEHIHRYSISDLEQTSKGCLGEQLSKIAQFGQEHILNCALCSRKGYFCELCQSNNILYPFDIDTTMKCNLCGSMYHAECATRIQTCPKCEPLSIFAQKAVK